MDVSNIKVSVVIASHNRYESLLAAISSVTNQTHKNIEVIVVNDNSSDPHYYTDRPKGVVWIDLQKNSKKIFGYPCPGYVRNSGLEVATGEYIAFLDDDDSWLPEKITSQLDAMITGEYLFCCTEAFMGDGIMDSAASYPVYHREYFQDFSKRFFDQYGVKWTGQLPDIFDKNIISKHNFIVTSSVLIEKRILDQVGVFKLLPVGQEDHELWIRCLEAVDCLHLNTPLVYYDGRLSQVQNDSKLHRRILNKMKRLF